MYKGGGNGKTTLTGGLLLVGLTVFFFHKALLTDTITLIWDDSDYGYPLLAYTAHAYRELTVPLWNPFLLNGYPGVADSNVQTFYPINLVIALFTEFTPRVMYVQLVVHYLLAGLFMFLLCRRLRYEPVSAILAAMAYMFSGFMVGHLEHHSTIATAAWLPLVFLCFDAALEEKSWRKALGGGMALGMCVLAGHSQTAFYIVFVLVIHFGYRSLQAYRQDQRPMAVWRNLGLLFLMGCVALLLTAIQLIPTVEFIAQSNRATGRTLESAGWGIPWSHLVTLFIPNYFGGVTGPYWGSVDVSQQSLYMGVLPFFLVVLALAQRTPRVIYYATMAVVSFLISMGAYTPVFSVLYHTVPGFALFRQVGQFLFIVQFYCALLVAEGGTLLSSRKISDRTVVYSAGCVFLAAAALYFTAPRPSAPAAPADARLGMLVSLGLVGFAVLLVKLAKDRPHALLPKAAWIVMVFLDLWLVTGQSLTLGSRMSPDRLEQETKAVAFLKQDMGIREHTILYKSSLDLDEDHLRNGLFRVYVTPPDRPYRLPDDAVLLGFLGFNRALLHKVFLVDGYSPIVLKRHQEFSEGVGGKNLMRFLQLSNVKYYATVGKALSLSKLVNPLPRALVVPHAEAINDSEGILRRLSDSSFDAFSTVVIEAESASIGGAAIQDAVPAEAGTRGSSGAVFTGYGPNRLTIETASEQPGYLLVNDAYDPGWKAFVDGRETRVYRANYEFRAIAIPQGAHQVEMVFRPTWFPVGLMVSGLTLLIVGFAIFRRSK